MFQRKIFRSTSEKDEMVFARVSEYIYVEEIRVPIYAQCDTSCLKISLGRNFVFFRCLSSGSRRKNELHFIRPNISEQANDLLHMTDKMKTFYWKTL